MLEALLASRTMLFPSEPKPSVVGKAEQIQQVLSEPEVDLWKLRELALSEGGLVNDTLRQRAWPKLIGMVVATESYTPASPQNDSTASNPYVSIVPTYPQHEKVPVSAVSFKDKTSRRLGEARTPHPSVAVDAASVLPSLQEGRPNSGEPESPQKLDEETKPEATITPPQQAAAAPEPQAALAEPTAKKTEEEAVETKNQSAEKPTPVAPERPTISTSEKPVEPTGVPPRPDSTASNASAGRGGGVYFRGSGRMRNMHHDDISISSSTTASMSNVGPVGAAGSTSGRRYNLPILATSLDFRQIELDVQRCTWHLLTGNQRAQRLQMEHKRNRKIARLIRRKQRRLANLINYTLVQSYPLTSPNKLRYYQGFHDVACIFMSILGGSTAAQPDPTVPQDMHDMAAAMGLDLPARLLVRVAQSHLRDSLKTDFKELQTAIELTLFPLIAKLDPILHDFLRGADMQPFFALSWVITWFAHEVRDTELVKRLFDVFLVSHPLMPIYLSVAMVLHPTNRQIVLAVEQDFGTVHQTLRNLTKNSSMTGWKYRPGDGYVSDDEEEDDDEEEKGDSFEKASLAGDIDKMKSALGEDPNSTTLSSVSTCVGSLPAEGQTRVPFQELIDLALVVMRRIPPRKLLPLAVRYYGGPHVAALLAHSPNIRLFSDPPKWAVKSHATADWVLHQRALKNGTTPDKEAKMADEPVSEESLKEVLLRMRKSPAVISLGFGEGEDKMRRRRRRRRIFTIGAIGVAIVAIAIGVMIRKSAPPEAPVCTQDDIPVPEPVRRSRPRGRAHATTEDEVGAKPTIMSTSRRVRLSSGATTTDEAPEAQPAAAPPPQEAIPVHTEKEETYTSRSFTVGAETGAETGNALVPVSQIPRQLNNRSPWAAVFAAGQQLAKKASHAIGRQARKVLTSALGDKPKEILHHTSEAVRGVIKKVVHVWKNASNEEILGWLNKTIEFRRRKQPQQ